MRCVLFALAALFAVSAAASEKRIVCYFGSWAVYRPGNGKFDISYIDPTLCTHLIYTFVGITEDGDVRVLDAWQDLPDNYGKDAFGRFNKLREKSPGTKTLIAIGGWNEGSTKYSHVVNNPTIRKRFVENAVKFVKKYGFDGFDMDWEYPNQRGGIFDDKKNYVLLLKELRQRFDAEGLILSAAVGAAEVSASKSYIISEVSKYLHFINLMAYDLNGIWNKKTGINAPLYAGSWETAEERGLNVNASVQYWLSHGADPKKIVVGVPFYGRTFTLADTKSSGIGATAYQPGQAGRYTREPGFVGYNEICEGMLTEKWETHYQEEQRVPYLVHGNQWVGYDNVKSLTEKANYINDLGLGGVMVWSIETDDFNGVCGEKYPLLKALNKALRYPSYRPSSPPSIRPPFSPPTSSRPVSGGPSMTCPPPPVCKCPSTEPPAGAEIEDLPDEDGDEDLTDNEDNDLYPEHETPKEEEHDDKGAEKDFQGCKGPGFARDPDDCGTFYMCRSNGEGGFYSAQFKCPDGLHFDLKYKTCNYAGSVDC